MTIIPAIVPPLPRKERWKRGIAPATALTWLKQGWDDLTVQPGLSIAYGVMVFLISAAIVFVFGR